MKEPKQRSVIVYCRVSTAHQAIEGISLEAQEARATAWCTAHGHQLAGVFIDAGVSGKRTCNRPQLQLALAAVKKARGILVCYSLSRLSRSACDTLRIVEDLQRSKADLASLSESIDTSSAAGALFLTMLAGFAQFERDTTSERTKAALSHKRAKGEKLGGRLPYGFKLDEDQVRLIQDGAEQLVLMHIRELRDAGRTYRAIAAELDNAGIRPRSGRAWSPALLRSICTRDPIPVAA